MFVVGRMTRTAFESEFVPKTSSTSWRSFPSGSGRTAKPMIMGRERSLWPMPVVECR